MHGKSWPRDLVHIDHYNDRRGKVEKVGSFISVFLDISNYFFFVLFFGNTLYPCSNTTVFHFVQ